ncbi:hypothetical protein [Methanolobus sp.]|jgi:hypothetical protein|uniref:hypothetical protein n=1 Tax=Methanolobus sp. TaxID=1874737 RepID=UPI0025F8EC7F|nr:hypothetical protein [Methanolobus sp.]
MFELAKTDDGVTFCKLEHAFELDKLKIGEFSYFRKYLGMADYLANFRSWLKRPTVALVLAISNNTVVGWAMNEKWSSPSSDGRPVYVLRGIEISPQLARRGMGKNMFFLISNMLMGHVITKPVNKTAKLFFESLNFEEPSLKSPVYLSDHPGYLILEEDQKEALSFNGISLLDENIMSCKLKMFPKEMCLEATKKSAKPEAIASCTVIGDDAVDIVENEVDVTLQQQDLKPEQQEVKPVDSQEEFIFDGKFIGEQKMMSPCKCGHNFVNKYQVTGKRTGTAFICTKCNGERYFLPLKTKSK